MEKVKADQETRLLVMLQVEDGGPDGEAAVENAPASNRTELGGGQEVGEEGEQASHEHFCKEFVVSAEEGDWPQLVCPWDARYFGEKPDDPLL
jgi:hypothetical protein